MDVKPYKIPHPFRKQTKKLIDKIVKDIAEGSTCKYAAQSNMVSETIFHVWRRQGEVDISMEVDSLSAYLVSSLAKIKQCEIKHCRSLILHTDKSHRGAEWTLEHAYWREFGSSAPLMQLTADIEAFKAQFKSGDPNVDTHNNEA
jgi:hypothetical protein